MEVLKLRWLGPPSIEYEGRPLHLEMRKALALLAYISLSPQPPARETLAALFWPEFDQRHALSNLRRSLSSLARDMPAGTLEIGRERIGLQRTGVLEMDVEEFKAQLARASLHSSTSDPGFATSITALEKATAVYKGDFFEGFNLKDCPDFDEWQFYQRESLRSEYAAALEKLAVYYQGHGEWEKALIHARSWTALDPLNEAAQRMLIGLYCQSGRRSLAVRQYGEFAREMKEQLGQAPEPETARLVEPGSQAKTVSTRNTIQASPLSTPVPLLKTKLYIPSARSRRVKRDRLVGRMEECAAQALTLISAPAGYGKTTLLAEWATITDLPVAWVSLDAADNDPSRFFAYIGEAVNSVHPGAADQALEMLHSSMPLALTTVISTLLNDLCEVSEPFALVLDDYHLITAQAVHTAMAFMLEHSTPEMHLVIATRTDPPLPLARLRSRQQLAEIRASDLRFYRDETTEFLNRIAGLNLGEEDITSLEARTEGWIAGLQMAALSMQGRQDLSRFIHSFTGSHRYIMDYLVDEVLERQPEEIQRFLLHTSILRRLSGPLCDALLDQKDSQSILEQLEKANLFLVSLDDDRTWYRFHHLFADLLNARLKQQSPELISALHTRCSQWLEANGFMDEAVDHALAAQDFDRASQLVDRLAGPMIARSGGLILQGWIDQLPTEIALSRPWLCISQAWVRLATGLVDQVEPLLQAAEQKIQPEDPPQQRRELLAQIACLRAYLADLCGNLPGMIRMAEQALGYLATDDIASREKVCFILGRAYLTLGQFAKGITVVSESIQQSIDAGTINMISPCLAIQCKIYRLQGRLHDVISLYLDKKPYIEKNARRLYLAGNAYIGPAGVLREWNDLEGAETTIRHALDLIVQWENPSVICAAYTMLGRVFQAQGKLEAAAEAIHSAEAAFRGRLTVSDVLGELNSARVKLWLATGELAKAAQWAENWKKNLGPDAAFSIALEQDEITISRVLAASQQTEEALQILSRLEEQAEIGGRFDRLIEILVFQAIALYAQERVPEALPILGRGLTLAQPEGYLRMFLDEGAPMADLLQQGKIQGTWHKLALDAYVGRLLSAF